MGDVLKSSVRPVETKFTLVSYFPRRSDAHEGLTIPLTQSLGLYSHLIVRRMLKLPTILTGRGPSEKLEMKRLCEPLVER